MDRGTGAEVQTLSTHSYRIYTGLPPHICCSPPTYSSASCVVLYLVCDTLILPSHSLPLHLHSKIIAHKLKHLSAVSTLLLTHHNHLQCISYTSYSPFSRTHTLCLSPVGFTMCLRRQPTWATGAITLAGSRDGMQISHSGRCWHHII